MTQYLVIAALLVGSVLLWLAGRWLRERFSVARGVNKTAPALRHQLVSYKYGITGKPDLIIEHDGYPIPVLVKSGRANNSPHESHVAQIIIYCLLIEETTSITPPYGIVRYDNRTFEVDYDEETYNSLLQLLDEMHTEREQFANPLPRSHKIQQRCYACRHRKHCDESLVKK